MASTLKLDSFYCRNNFTDKKLASQECVKLETARTSKSHICLSLVRVHTTPGVTERERVVHYTCALSLGRHGIDNLVQRLVCRTDAAVMTSRKYCVQTAVNIIVNTISYRQQLVCWTADHQISNTRPALVTHVTYSRVLWLSLRGGTVAMQTAAGIPAVEAQNKVEPSNSMSSNLNDDA